MLATPSASRRKVRCPKCTALFSEPAKSKFECPICSCRLSAGQASPLAVVPLNGKEKDKAVRLENAASSGDGMSMVDREEACLRDENASHEDTCSEALGENRGAIPTAAHEGVQEPFEGVPETDNEEEKIIRDGSTEDPNGNRENTAFKSSSIANTLALVNNEALEGDGSSEKGDFKTRKDLRLLQTSRCELSFKYAFEGAHPVKPDKGRNSLPPSKFASSTLSNEASDAPLHTQLRVRISSRDEESSDPSENGRYSFSSETESHDGSESDFDFPATWANGEKNKRLSDSLGQYEPVHNLSEGEVPAASHQLESWDAHDITNKGQGIAEKPGKHSEKSDINLYLQADNVSQPVSPSRKKNQIKEHKETSRFDLLSQVQNLAKIMTNAVNLDNNRNPDEDVASIIPLNHRDIPSVSRLHVQHVSYEGSSKHDDVHDTTYDGQSIAEESSKHSEDSDLKLLLQADNASQSKFPSRKDIHTKKYEEASRFDLFSQVNNLPKIMSHAITDNDRITAEDVAINVPLNKQNTPSLSGLHTQHVSYEASSKHHVHDTNNKGQHIAEESGKRLENSDIKLFLQAGNVSQSVSPSSKENQPKEHKETSRFDLFTQVNYLSKVMSHTTDQNCAEDFAANITLNHQDIPSVSGLHMQQVSYEGSSKHYFHALREYDTEQVAYSGLSNGRTSVFEGSLSGVHSIDRIKQGKLIYTHTQPHVRDNDLPPDIEVEHDLYKHCQIGEWQHEQDVEFPSSANHCYEVMDHQNHEKYLKQMSLHQSKVLDNAASSTFFPNSPPVHHHFLGHEPRFEQIDTHQLPSRPTMLPAPLGSHSMAPCKFHPVPNGCTLGSHHHCPCIQAHSCPQGVVCACQSGSVTYNLGHCTQRSHYQPFSCLGPAFTSLLVPCTEECTSLSQSHDLRSANAILQAHVYGNPSQYPPLPKDGAAPYVLCKGCCIVLRVPSKLSQTNGCVQKLRCSACGYVNKFSINQFIKQNQGPPNLSLLEMNLKGRVWMPNMLQLVQYNTGTLHCSHNQRVLPSLGHQCDSSSGMTKFQDYTSLFASQSNALPLSSEDRAMLQLSNLSVSGSINMDTAHCEITSTVAIHTSSKGDNVKDREQVTAVSSLHETMDEKDEGLDFGAPRISDGESLDPNESRTRSPDYIQTPRTNTETPEAGVPKTDSSDDGKQRGPPLLVLLNQESTRFSLSLGPIPDEEVKSASWSPASDSHLPNFLKRREYGSSQARKGRKYIAGLLRRSLKDFSKVGNK